MLVKSFVALFKYINLWWLIFNIQKVVTLRNKLKREKLFIKSYRNNLWNACVSKNLLDLCSSLYTLYIEPHLSLGLLGVSFVKGLIFEYWIWIMLLN